VLRRSGLELVAGGVEPVRVPRVLRQPNVASFDARGQVVEEPIEDSHPRSYDEGFEAGRESARQQLMSAANALQNALETCRQELRDEFEHQRVEMVQVAIGLAEFVLGHANHDGGKALMQRLGDALSMLDDQQLTISMSEVDIPLAGQIDAAGIVVVADPDLAPGEARVVGDWARADLTRKAALDLLRDNGGLT
jgi:flagellar biosynthesis/type III secretory pathway protein FliH